MHRSAAAFALVLLAAPRAVAETRTVGVGKTYSKPCAAFAAASDGDTIAIDAGSYDGDVCVFKKNNLTIKGVGGRAKIDALGDNAGGKAIWVIQGNDTTIENVELSGAAVPDQNGAAIRQEGNNLTLRNVFFHDNENGILGGGSNASSVVIEDSEFARNGAGDGYSHNLYIGEIKSFTLRGSYSHQAKVGHLVKSRALENIILYNRLTDEDGTASYEIDLPQGGVSYIIGNIIQQSADTENSAMVSFAKESKRNPGSALFVVNNTFYNSRSAGIFITVAGDLGVPVLVRNNIFGGPGTMIDQPSALKDSNFAGDALFIDPAAYDFQLKGGSPAVDKGVAAGTGAGRPLTAGCQYVHPAHAVVREAKGAVDLGAFEMGGESTLPCGAAPMPGGDSGTNPVDSGVSVPVDSGTPPDDGSGSLGGTSVVETEENAGCSCSSSAGAGAGLSMSAVGVLAFLSAIRRRAAVSMCSRGRHSSGAERRCRRRSN